MVRCMRCGRVANHTQSLVERDVDGNIIAEHIAALCGPHYEEELRLQYTLPADPFTSDVDLAMWRRVTPLYEHISGILMRPRYPRL